MKRIRKNSLVVKSIALSLTFFYGCTGGNGINPDQRSVMENDTELQVPDVHGGGHILTPLGRLIYGPWQVENPDFGYNAAIYFGDTEISSLKQLYNEVEKEFVFEMQRDGSLKYWFKKDYEHHATAEDNAYEKKHIAMATHYRPGVDQIKKIYTKGNWQVNFKDSTLIIQFDDGNLPQLNGRYSDLGSGFMSFQRISFFDSLYNGQKVKLKKVLTTYYEHPWNNW